MGSGPSGLEVEASRNTIDVEHFASEVKPRVVLAFEGVAVDTRKGNAATGDEFIFESCTTQDEVVVIDERVDETMDILSAECAASFLWCFLQTANDDVLPQTLRQS